MTHSHFTDVESDWDVRVDLLRQNPALLMCRAQPPHVSRTRRQTRVLSRPHEGHHPEGDHSEFYK